MMGATLNILILEVAIVFFVIICVLSFFIWKRKKTQAKQFEQLLETLDKQQDERKQKLSLSLIDGYALEEKVAQESGEYMVEAEKQFIQQFMKQQMEQTTIAGFYDNLCELLDQYLYFVPKINEDEKTPSESVMPEENSDESDETLESEAAKLVEEDEGEVNSKDITEEVDEETDIIDTKQEIDHQEEVKEEEEPDWGDAFSEAGDEMDDEAKESYESELKKE